MALHAVGRAVGIARRLAVPDDGWPDDCWLAPSWFSIDASSCSMVPSIFEPVAAVVPPVLPVVPTPDRPCADNNVPMVSGLDHQPPVALAGLVLVLPAVVAGGEARLNCP